MTTILICATLLCHAAPPEARFDADFTGAVLRIDYYHTGTAAEEHFALDRVRVEGIWPGSTMQLVDRTNLGKYLVEIADLPSNAILYSRGFASIYGEWETTGEARAGTWRCLPEAVRIPEPRRPFQLRMRKRGTDQVFREVWSVTIDPGSRFVDRAAVAPREVYTLVDNGTPTNKVDVLLLGDGYTSSELGVFRDAADRATHALFKHEPFASRRADFNVRAICPPAAESGVARPRARAFHDSPLGARYNSFDSERYVLTMMDRKWRDIAAAAPYDCVIILVNERQYGGGGIYNLYATASARSSYADYLVVHEFGHSFAGLGDEYYTSDVAYEAFTGTRTEPWEPNITALGDPQTLKWRTLLSDDTPLPTTWKKTEHEERAATLRARRRQLRAAGAPEDKLEALFDEERALFTRELGAERYASRVGAFEGAMYEASGLYRPSADCIMFTRDKVGFCPVCRRAISRVIDTYTRQGGASPPYGVGPQ